MREATRAPRCRGGAGPRSGRVAVLVGLGDLENTGAVPGRRDRLEAVCSTTGVQTRYAGPRGSRWGCGPSSPTPGHLPGRCRVSGTKARARTVAVDTPGSRRRKPPPPVCSMTRCRFSWAREGPGSRRHDRVRHVAVSIPMRPAWIPSRSHGAGGCVLRRSDALADLTGLGEEEAVRASSASQRHHLDSSAGALLTHVVFPGTRRTGLGLRDVSVVSTPNTTGTPPPAARPASSAHSPATKS